MSPCALIISLLVTSIAASHQTYKFCVGKRYDEDPPNVPAFVHCRETAKKLHEFGVHLQCVSGEDSLDCLEKVAKGEAHVTLLVHPEDLYLASRHFPSDMVVIAEVRKDAEQFRYEAAVLVRLSSGINSVEHLKGKRTCLSSIHRVEEWATDDFVLHLIMGKLLELGVVKTNCEEISALEREFATMSQFFGSSCSPGQWFYGKKLIEHQLKTKYSSLTSLCKEPSFSSQYDDYAGVDGALQCLLEVGDVAFTTISAARSDRSLMAYADEYGFLCPDGRMEPIDFLLDGKPCTWGGAPWPAFVASSTLVKSSLEKLQKQVSIMAAIREKYSLMFNDLDELFSPEITAGVFVPLQPPPLIGDHMKKNNYSWSIERARCPNEKPLRLCTRSVDEQVKCRAFQMAALSRRILPELSCIPGMSAEDCLDKINRGKADLISADSGLLHAGKSHYNLEAILSENPPGSDRNYYLVAIVRNDSGVRTLDDLKGKKICYISHAGNDYGWQYPIRILKDAGQIPESACNLNGAFESLFSNVCVFGTHLSQGDPRWGNLDKRCELCQSTFSECPTRSSRTAVSEEQVFRCLADRLGDVAFVTLHQGLREFNDYLEADIRKVAIDLDFDSLCLLCPHEESPLQPLTSYYQCYWGIVPGRKVITRTVKTPRQLKNYLYVLLEAAELFKRKSSPFWLFGPFHGNHDLIFHDNTKRFYPLPMSDSSVAPIKQHEDVSRYLKMVDRTPHCSTSHGKSVQCGTIVNLQLVIITVIIFSKEHCQVLV